MASPGVQSFAELGVTVELVKGAKDARKRRVVGSMYRTAGLPSGIGHSSTELVLQPRNPLVLNVSLTPDTDLKEILQHFSVIICLICTISIVYI